MQAVNGSAPSRCNLVLRNGNEGVGMAITDEMKKEMDRGGKPKKKRGTVNNARRLAAFGERRGGSDADWGSCNPHLLQAVVVKITGMGGAITLGLSRDKGAHSLTLLLDGDKETLWFNRDAALDAELEMVLETLG